MTKPSALERVIVQLEEASTRLRVSITKAEQAIDNNTATIRLIRYEQGRKAATRPARRRR